MSADNFNITSLKIITILISGTVSGQYRWEEVTDNDHIEKCQNEIGPTSRLEGKVFTIRIAENNLRIFKYRDYVPMMTKDSSVIKTKEGSVVVVLNGDESYVLEFYEPSDYSSRLKLNQSNSIRDLYDTIVKSVFSVDDFLKNLQTEKDNNILTHSN